MNLMNMAMRYIGPAVAERVASKLGIGGPVVNKLIAAAMPALMGSLIGKSKTSSGLGSIMDLVTGANRPDPGGLETMFNSGGDIDGFASAGGGMLEGLLGNQGVGALTGALGRHAGVDEAQAGSLLGMLAPAALGSIGNQVSEQGLDAAGLGQFLQGQAGNVAASMPAGFASELGGSGLLDGIQDSLSGVAGSASDAVSSASAAAQNVAESAEAGAKKSMGMLPLIIGALVIAGLAWFFLGRGGDAPEVDTSALTGGEAMVVGDVDVGEQFGSITGSLTETFQGITDTASAEAAIPQLEEITGQIGTLGESAGELSGVAKTGFQGIVGTALEQLRPIIDSAIEASGAEAILRPVADQVLGALEGLAG